MEIQKPSRRRRHHPEEFKLAVIEACCEPGASVAGIAMANGVNANQVRRWIYGTHSMRRTKATLIYKRTKNLRAVQLLLGHSKLESTVRYLGIEVDDALEISEQTEI